AFGTAHAPAFGAIVALALLLIAIFATWMIAAQAIYDMTLGPDLPRSLAGFAHDVLDTSAGWVMIAAGIGVGFLFAVLVLLIGVVSFPMLLDRHVSFGVAVWTSVNA